MIIEGTTEKVSKFIMRTKTIYKNICVLMSTAERFEHNKIFIITSFLLYLFRAALYKLVFPSADQLEMNYKQPSYLTKNLASRTILTTLHCLHNLRISPISFIVT